MSQPKKRGKKPRKRMVSYPRVIRSAGRPKLPERVKRRNMTLRCNEHELALWREAWAGDCFLTGRYWERFPVWVRRQLDNACARVARESAAELQRRHRQRVLPRPTHEPDGSPPESSESGDDGTDNDEEHEQAR